MGRVRNIGSGQTRCGVMLSGVVSQYYSMFQCLSKHPIQYLHHLLVTATHPKCIFCFSRCYKCCQMFYNNLYIHPLVWSLPISCKLSRLRYCCSNYLPTKAETNFGNSSKCQNLLLANEMVKPDNSVLVSRLPLWRGPGPCSMFDVAALAGPPVSHQFYLQLFLFRLCDQCQYFPPPIKSWINLRSRGRQVVTTTCSAEGGVGQPANPRDWR